jgi:hypothetical protein
MLQLMSTAVALLWPTRSSILDHAMLVGKAHVSVRLEAFDNTHLDFESRSPWTVAEIKKGSTEEKHPCLSHPASPVFIVIARSASSVKGHFHLPIISLFLPLGQHCTSRFQDWIQWHD